MSCLFTAKWESDIEGMLSKLDASVDETDRVLTKIKTSLDQLETEQEVIIEWNINVNLSDDVFIYFEELGLVLDADLKSEVTGPLQSLVNICNEFLKISNRKK